TASCNADLIPPGTAHPVDRRNSSRPPAAACAALRSQARRAGNPGAAGRVLLPGQAHPRAQRGTDCRSGARGEARCDDPRAYIRPGIALPHRFVAIRDARDRSVVTVIEFLSPWNKTGEGREEYRDK